MMWLWNHRLGIDKQIKYLKARSIWKSVSVNVCMRGKREVVWPDVQVCVGCVVYPVCGRLSPCACPRLGLNFLGKRVFVNIINVARQNATQEISKMLIHRC